MLRLRYETGEGTGMNDETLRFAPGETVEVPPMEVVDVDDKGVSDCLAPLFISEIHVIGEEIWIGRVTAAGFTAEAAEALRDRLLWALQQPTVPAQWQRYSPGGTETDGQWVNLDNGGEAARLKGEGYEIRALYAKQPLVQP